MFSSAGPAHTLFVDQLLGTPHDQADNAFALLEHLVYKNLASSSSGWSTFHPFGLVLSNSNPCMSE